MKKIESLEILFSNEVSKDKIKDFVKEMKLKKFHEPTDLEKISRILLLESNVKFNFNITPNIKTVFGICHYADNFFSAGVSDSEEIILIATLNVKKPNSNNLEKEVIKIGIVSIGEYYRGDNEEKEKVLLRLGFKTLLTPEEESDSYINEKYKDWLEEYQYIPWDKFKDEYTKCSRCKDYGIGSCICYAR